VKIDLLGESESCKQFRSAECGVVRQMGSSDVPGGKRGCGDTGMGWPFAATTRMAPAASGIHSCTGGGQRIITLVGALALPFLILRSGVPPACLLVAQ